MTFAVPARERPKPRSAPDHDCLAVPVEVRAAKVAAALAKRGIVTAGDLLETPPRAWRDWSEGVTALGDVVVGAETTVRVELISVHVRPTRRRNLRIVEAAVRDDSGAATAIWFNQGFLARTLLPGQLLQLRCTVRAGRRLELTVREHERAGRGGGGVAHERRGGRLRRLEGALDARPARACRAAPAAQRRDRGSASGRCAHRPPPAAAARRHRRAACTAHAGGARSSPATAWPTRSCCCCRSRSPSGAQALPPAEPLGRPGELLERYRASLPFTLTTGQKRSVRDIDRDLARARPMRRLLLGDVGSGKTVVAVHAMLRRRRARRPGGPAGAHRGARPAARRDRARPGRAARDRAGGDHRRPPCGGAARSAAAHRLGRCRARGRNARAPGAQRRVPRNCG